jgi:dolichyl-phosphate beta-glucosyltransferase
LLLLLQGPAFTYEVIIVDDGSKDSTAAVAMGFVKRHGVDAVRLLRLPYNCGKGRAVREGMLIARGELCLMMDADGATRVSDMEQLEAGIKVCPLFFKTCVSHTCCWLWNCEPAEQLWSCF